MMLTLQGRYRRVPDILRILSLHLHSWTQAGESRRWERLFGGLRYEYVVSAYDSNGVGSKRWGGRIMIPAAIGTHRPRSHRLPDCTITPSRQIMSAIQPVSQQITSYWCLCIFLEKWMQFLPPTQSKNCCRQNFWDACRSLHYSLMRWRISIGAYPILEISYRVVVSGILAMLITTCALGILRVPEYITQSMQLPLTCRQGRSRCHKIIANLFPYLDLM